MGRAVIVTPEELEVMKEQAVAEYPREACGVTLVRDGERKRRELQHQRKPRIHDDRPVRSDR